MSTTSGNLRSQPPPARQDKYRRAQIEFDALLDALAAKDDQRAIEQTFKLRACGFNVTPRALLARLTTGP